MITEKDLQEAIAECQDTTNPTSNTCIKLAAYYTIQDHLYNSYSYSDGPAAITYDSKSEFSDIVKRMDINDVLSVVDELMNTIQAINPRLYEGVITKLLS